VVRALEKPEPDPTYLEFFGFERSPFARLSRPSQVFHTEQYSLLTAHLAVATEQSDCLVVICGADGSGKTTLLNRYITGLSDEISYATIDETCNGEKKFYLAFLRQLGFKDITGKVPELRRITEEFLVNRGMAGDPVLMIIDNAHLVKPTVLEQLRRVSAVKARNRRVLSLVLAGNSDLVGIMDSPVMSQIKFRSHVLFNIRVYTEEETASYIWHHLSLAGATDIVNFSTEANALIYRYAGGVPNLINVLCNDVLTEACALKSRDITEDLVRTVADKRRLSPHVVPRQGEGRRSTDPDFKLEQSEQQAGERITARDSKTRKAAQKATPKLEMPDVDGKKLLDQIAELSERVGAIKADRERTLEDIGTREKDLSGLRKKLAAVTTETEKLTVTLGDNSTEIERLNQELSDSTKSLEKSEKASKKLTADLKKEKNAAKTTQTAIAKSKATVEELTQQKTELQASVSKLTTDLKLAEEQVAEISVLEKSNAALKDEIEKHAGQLVSKDEDIGELEKMLQESQNECASLRVRVATLNNLEKSVSEADARIADLKADLASHNQGIEALEAKNGEPESRDVEPAQAEDISTLESDPDEDDDDPTITGTRSIAIEKPDLTAAPKIKERKPPKIRQKPDLDETVSTPGPAARQSDAVITAFEVFNKDGKTEQVMELAKGQSRIMIGRSEDSELRLDSAFVSRHHALIFCTEQGVYIENLNSFNGTLVNSEKITRHDLRVGDVVTIGDFEIRPRQA